MFTTLTVMVTSSQPTQHYTEIILVIIILEIVSDHLQSSNGGTSSSSQISSVKLQFFSESQSSVTAQVAHGDPMPY